MDDSSKRWRISRRHVLAGGAGALLLPSLGLAEEGPPQISMPLPGRHEFNFLAIGDWGRGDKDQKDVADAMALSAGETAPRFVLSTGDNFYWKGVTSARDDKWARVFQEVYHEPSLQKPWYPSLGNHDYGGNAIAQVERSGLDSRWRMKNRWYRVRGREVGHPDLDIFVIDTVVWKLRESKPWFLLGSRIGDNDALDQYNWLADELFNSTAKFKLVVGHHPIYSVGPHGGKPDLGSLDRLLRRTGATAYICGHDHCLYHIRSAAMDYVCSGGGSQFKADYMGLAPGEDCVIKTQCEPAPEATLTFPRVVKYVGASGFATLSLRGDVLRLWFHDTKDVRHYSEVPARQPDPSVELKRPLV